MTPGAFPLIANNSPDLTTTHSAWYRITWRSHGSHLVWTASSVLAGLVVWSLLAVADPVLVPSVGEVAGRIVDTTRSGALPRDVKASVLRVLMGFGLGSAAAVAVGLAIGLYSPVRRLAGPWIQFFRMIPPLALIPVAIVYLGIGEVAKVSVIALAVFLTVVIATIQGVAEANPVLVRAAKVLGANERQMFLSVILPGAVPYILVGLRLGLAAGWTTVVAAELIAASAGLGYLDEISGTFFDMTGAYVALIFIGIFGVLMDTVVTRMERWLTPWAERVTS